MAIRLNSRCLDVLSLLVSYNQPVAAADIADKLNLSPRMVRTSLDPACPWLHGKGITLRQVPGEGYSLVGSPEAKRSLEVAIRKYDGPLPWLSRSERIHVILLTLFFSHDPTQIKQLEKSLNLSRTTTIKAMDAAEEWLKEYRLKLVRRPNYGSEIVGEEHNWREAALCLLQESAGDARLLAQVQGLKTVVDVSFRTNTGLEEVLGKVWAQLDIALIKKAISPTEREFPGTFSDRAYIRLFFALAIAVYRNRSGKGITAFSESSVPALPGGRLSGTRRLAARLQKQFGIDLPESEITWIALSAPEPDALPTDSDRRQMGTMTQTDSAIQSYVDRIVGEASISLHPSLSADPELIRNLTVHVRSLLEPQEWASSTRNQLLREVKSQYPYVFSVAKKCSLALADPLGRDLNEAEIGDIAVCLIAAMERLRQSDRPTKKVLVVCSEGAVTAWLLVSRLRAEFPDVEVIDAISARELENRKHVNGIDFIVSTVPLRMANVPTKQVNPLLGLEDCKRLRELFEREADSPRKNGLARPLIPHLSDLLTPATIELGLVAETWQEVVEKAGAKLLECGAIERRFIRAMKEVILQHGPYMVIWPGVVLLHAPPDGVRRLCMGLANLRKPVRFGHVENDPVRIAVILGAVDNHSHISALQELNRMMQDSRARSAIQETISKSSVLHWVSHYSKMV